MSSTGIVNRARRETVAYLALAYGLATAISVALPDAEINLLLTVAVPIVVVGLLTVLATPHGGRRTLWRGLGLGRVGWRLWPAALAIPVVLSGAAYGAALAVGAGRVVGLDVGAAYLATTLVLGTVFIMGEEIGWRGYLLPRVRHLTGQRRGAVITGFLHGSFHLPLILVATTYDVAGSRWYAAPAAVLTITAGGVFYAWLRDRSGSLWPVALAHNAVNTGFEVGALAVVATSPGSLAYVAGETGVATLLACGVLAAILLRLPRESPGAIAQEQTPSGAAVPSTGRIPIGT